MKIIIIIYLIGLFFLFSCGISDKLIIETEPAEAEVYFQNQYLGKTPIELQKSNETQALFSGSYFTLKKEFFKSYSVKITPNLFSNKHHYELEVDKNPLQGYDGNFKDNYKYSEKNLEKLTPKAIRLLQAEIYLKYGGSIDDFPEAEEITHNAWYKANPYFTKDFLNETDLANLKLFTEYKINKAPLTAYTGIYSGEKILTKKDVHRKTIVDLNRLRTEIYAQYGADLSAYPNKEDFYSSNWYKQNPQFDDSFLTEIDKLNLAFLNKQPKQRGLYFFTFNNLDYSDVLEIFYISPNGKIDKQQPSIPIQLAIGKPNISVVVHENYIYHYGPPEGLYCYSIKDKSNIPIYIPKKWEEPHFLDSSFDESLVLFSKYDVNDEAMTRSVTLCEYDILKSTLVVIKNFSLNSYIYAQYLSSDEIIIKEYNEFFENNKYNFHLYERKTGKLTTIEGRTGLIDISFDGKILSNQGYYDIDTGNFIECPGLDLNYNDIWSPDGTEILHIINNNGKSRLSVYNIETQQDIPLNIKSYIWLFLYDFMENGRKIIYGETLIPFNTKPRESIASSNIKIYDRDTNRTSVLFSSNNQLNDDSGFATACPFVYIRTKNGEFKKIGEILTQNQTPNSAGPSRIKLPVSELSAPVTLRISEELREVTFLDQVILVADGVTHYTSMPKEVALVDRNYKILTQGMSLELNFPEVKTNAETIELEVTGYFEHLH